MEDTDKSPKGRGASSEADPRRLTMLKPCLWAADVRFADHSQSLNKELA